MEYYSTRTMHVHAQEFSTDFWNTDNNFYSPLPIYSNEKGEPTIETFYGKHILSDKEFIVALPNKQYLALTKELFNFIYKPLLPYN